MGYSLFECGFEFAEIFDFEIANFVVNDPAEYSLRGVNDTADHWWAGSMTPPINILNCFFFTQAETPHMLRIVL
jgi:hypothetical protein